MNEVDLRHLRAAIAVAFQARSHGNEPFGAVLACRSGAQLLAAENTVITGNDRTAHAELNLVRHAAEQLNPDAIAAATIYCSTEPCLMCTGAIYWSGISRIVFALDQLELHRIVTHDIATTPVSPPCRDLLARGNRRITVHGPALQDEAQAAHTGFWHNETAQPGDHS